MKHLKLKSLSIALAFVIVLSSCHKDKVNPNTGTPTAEIAGLYVLNQGGFLDDNSTLTYYNFTTKTLIPDQYSVVNSGAKIGDTGNDIKVYGSKMYIVVNLSNVVDVVDPKTAKLIKQDSLIISKGVGRQPRSIAFYKNNAFITSYDGTVAVMDTTTLTISKYIPVGRNPEQMVISNGKLYVANSGGLSFGNPDNTVSVIDLTTLTEIKKITVIADPVTMAADNYGNIYVLSLGDFANIKAGLTVIDNTTDVVKSQSNPAFGYNIPFVVNGDFAYYVTVDANNNSQIAVYNVKTQTVAQANFITDGTVITTPFAININAKTGEVFIADALDYASNGVLYAFDKNGKKEYSIATGINPGKILFVNK